jgi:hypothetical protein
VTNKNILTRKRCGNRIDKREEEENNPQKKEEHEAKP